MFGFTRPDRNRESAAIVAAVTRSQAMVEFDLDGILLAANQNFLDLMGYTLAEVLGRHHRLFVDASYAESDEYHLFWQRLKRGEHHTAQFRRLAKGGRDVWIEALYNPVLDRFGVPYMVVKLATDVTAPKTEYAELKGQAVAINKSQAVVEFRLDGTVISANRKFLDTMGYTLAEIQGRHHRIFVEPSYAESPAYREFWDQLRQGEYQAAQFKRIGKDGRDVWIEASYNLILDLDGRPMKVVKYATDVTSQVRLLTNLKRLIDRDFGEIDRAVDQSSGEASHAAGAVQQASESVRRMAASAEQLAASVLEITGMMVQSRSATESAGAQAAGADQATQRLSQSSTAMGGIVALIREIAAQINLLALNATIESARAGEAGRGFAVVAGEVKNLAQQAANATNEISREIDGLQSVTAAVIAALESITHSIASIRGYVTNAASAVEQQSAVTQDMSTGMQTAAASISTINDNMAGIASAVQHVAHSVGNARTAAEVLVR